MKWTTDPVTQVLAKLRDSAALQGVDFCRAYPDQMKPSRLLHPVVAVCLAEVDGTSDAVGEESRAGQIALRFDLYAPPAAGTGALQQVLSGICRTLLDRRHHSPFSTACVCTATWLVKDRIKANTSCATALVE